MRALMLAGVLTALGCGAEQAAREPAPLVRDYAADRVARSAARYAVALDEWRVAWTRSGAPKKADLEEALREGGTKAAEWAASPTVTVTDLRQASSAHRQVAAKLFSSEDAALIEDLDKDAALNSDNAGRNALMAGALESSRRLRAAIRDLADALDGLAAALPTPKK